MLVLSRKAGEQVVIGGRVTVTVNRVQGNRVSLAIDAPSDVKILRGELRRIEDDLLDEPVSAAAREPAAVPTCVLRVHGEGLAESWRTLPR